MRLFKNWTKLKMLMLVLVCLVVIVAIYGVFVFIGNSPEPETVSYSGNNGSFSIRFTRFTDYDHFLENKSPLIILYNSKGDIQQNPPGSGYIAGEVVFNGSWEFNSCEVELIRESEWNTGTIAMNAEPGKKGSVSLPFTGEDFPDSAKNIYKTAIIRIEDKEVVIPLKASNPIFKSSKTPQQG